MSILQELEVGEAILADVGGFAAGAPVSASPTIGGEKVNVSVQLLPTGPAAPFTALQGSFFAQLTQALVLGAEFSAGAPIQLAVKEGNSWYGVTIAKAA